MQLTKFVEKYGPVVFWRSYYKGDKNKPIYWIKNAKTRETCWGKTLRLAMNAYKKHFGLEPKS